MQIKKISVTKLFGFFDYVLELNQQSHVTVIHGVNGTGKTTLLSLISAIAQRTSSSNRFIWHTPFRSFKVEFNDDSYVRVVKTLSDKNLKTNELGITWTHQKNKTFEKTFSLTGNIDEAVFPLESISQKIEELERVANYKWKDKRTKEILELDDIKQRYRKELLSQSELEWPSWSDEILPASNVRYISPRRLFTTTSLQLAPMSELFGGEYSAGDKSVDDDHLIATVMTCKDEIQRLIAKTINDSSFLAQSLDRTFPTRLMHQLVSGEESRTETIQDQLAVLDDRIKSLIGIGLYVPREDKLKADDLSNQHTRRVLALYLRDMDDKLKPLEDFAAKIKRFTDLANDHFQYKKLIVNRELGLAVQSDKGGDLSLLKLSSGEQHEIVLTFELLFNTTPETLVLIDEPEISLHIKWQLKFIDELTETITLSKFNAIIATHSPQIINNHWELAIQLGERDE